MKDWVGNGDSIYKSIGASNHALQARADNDYYATDPIAIDKLLTVETPRRFIWECACGGGHLSERLTEHGYCVFNSDIVNRGYEKQAQTIDFLKAKSSPFSEPFDILTNPPYKYAKEFVLKAVELLPIGCRCFMFLKLTFLEGKTRYDELFSKYPPQRIYVFPGRIACAKNGDFKSLEASGGSAVAYAWFVWLKGYKGETCVRWIVND